MTTAMLHNDYPFDNVVDALRYAANHTTEGILAYPANSINNSQAAVKLSYRELLNLAETNASKLRQRDLCKPGSVVLVHFDNALDSIIWYWSVLLAGAIPSVTGPGMFSQSAQDRTKHLNHIHNTFNGPLCLTRRSLMAPFLEQAGERRINVCAAEDLEGVTLANSSPLTPSLEPSPSSIAAVMLTSGSSGNAKAVPLTHRQLLAAFKGKSESANLQHPESPFLSWTHMDHVANLVHCHIFAIVSCVSQIQIAAADILLEPVQLLNLASRHHVSRMFAPNFLLAKILRLFKSGTASALDTDLNLEALYIDTGGEANVTEVCVGLQSVLSRYGAPADVFKPSFGMTETCAGCIVNDKCPSYDNSQRLGFTSLGEPVPGVQMRISRLDSPGTEVARGERGSLEITGDAIFRGYYNNPAATAEAFTSDGWFRTGDNAYIDDQEQLHLDGRTKEMININGVKYLPHELDSALEQAEIPGTTPSYFCCFAMRDTSKADTEVVVVLYLPSYDENDDEARYEAHSSIIRTCSMHTHSRPLVVPLRVQDMPKSTLGKLSRTKLKAALEEGTFADQKALNDEAIARYRQKVRGQPETIEEAAILYIVSQQLEMGFEDDFSVNDTIFSTGATSMDLVAIMQRLNGFLQASGHEKLIRLTDILKNPTARGIAAQVAVSTGKKKHEYDPIVTLQPHGNKTPLWLVHPGVGEVLVFVNLSHHVTDRPIHAFRARGFNAAEGETPFNSLSELFETYRTSIKKRQPHGPYAIAGYSFGGMVAFEVTKLLEAGGDEVRFCGAWNLPPHIKSRMRELLWDECVIHLFYFVGLMDEATAYTHKPALCAFEREGRRLDAIRYLRMYSDPARWDELGLDEEYYLLWVGLASNMQGLAVDYEPEGSVANMDVFVADPLSHVAKNREDWIKNRLAAWKDFVRSDVRFHHVEGAHYTMLNPEYVVNFAKTLRKVLRERGL
ncbi:acetyl-CoA synthetase-like protein [Annulohypoxylon moriforme]|nr:acetyl-CoA synthetase-like protein [Annulohypoxylon moriforme]